MDDNYKTWQLEKYGNILPEFNDPEEVFENGVENQEKEIDKMDMWFNEQLF